MQFPILLKVEYKASSGAWGHSLYINLWGTLALLFLLAFLFSVADLEDCLHFTIFSYNEKLSLDVLNKDSSWIASCISGDKNQIKTTVQNDESALMRRSKKNKECRAARTQQWRTKNKQ